jgi:phage shock protein C
MARREPAADHSGMTSSSPTTPRPVTRSTTDSKVAGVSGGLGRYFDVDPVLFRVGFVITTLLSGAGLLAYLVLWAIVPRDDRAAATPAPSPIAA